MTTGGVDVNDTSDDEYEGSEEEIWSSENNSDHSLIELEGEELDKNLQALQVEVEAEIAQLAGPTAFERILRPVPAQSRWKRGDITRATSMDARALLLQLSTVRFDIPKSTWDDPLSWIEAVKEAMTTPQPHQSVHDNSLGGILSICARDKFSSIANGFLAMLAHVQLVFKCQG